jgi:hypothetical protein
LQQGTLRTRAVARAIPYRPTPPVSRSERAGATWGRNRRRSLRSFERSVPIRSCGEPI